MNYSPEVQSAILDDESVTDIFTAVDEPSLAEVIPAIKRLRRRTWYVQARSLQRNPGRTTKVCYRTGSSRTTLPLHSCLEDL